MKALHLNLMKKWFNLTLQEVKKEEYRDITPYWANRLLCMDDGANLNKCYSPETIEFLCISLQKLKEFNDNSIKEVFNKFHIKFKKYNYIVFSNGYKSLDIVSRFIIEVKEITIGIGIEEWGFIGQTPKFIIKHGIIIEKHNC